MSSYHSKTLLAALFAIFAARGLEPDALDPWRGWIAFKQFAREVAEQPDPGVSVQIASLGRRSVRLAFVRQVVVAEGTWLRPVGGVVCELWLSPRHGHFRDWEAWSFDAPSFDRFVDLVEQHPPFAKLLTQRANVSAVYWEEA